MGLEGKVALVTGGAQGLGRAVVESLVDQGAKVYAVDIDAPTLDEMARATGAVPIVADVAAAVEVDRAVSRVEEPLDVLVNNAGIIDRLGSIVEVTHDEWHHVLGVNLTGPFLLCHRVVPGMLERGGGAIVNIASLASIRGGRAGVAYTASKHAVLGLTRNIAASLGARGIRCNAVCPGGMQTAQMENDTLPSAMEMIMRDTGIPPIADPRDVAKVVTFLSSDEASHINGAEIVVDQGWAAY